MRLRDPMRDLKDMFVTSANAKLFFLCLVNQGDDADWFRGIEHNMERTVFNRMLESSEIILASQPLCGWRRETDRGDAAAATFRDSAEMGRGRGDSADATWLFI